MRNPSRLAARLQWLLQLCALLLIALVVGIAGPAKAQEDEGDRFRLEGCRNDGTLLIPNANGDVLCADSAYTTGNMGKGWAEGDLVPHRVTVTAGTNAPASSTFTFAIVLDALDDGIEGYDYISPATLNTSLSAPSCSAASSGTQQTTSDFANGVDQSRYRLITITQAKATACVYDFYGRLAIGSSSFPGASLHANLALPAAGGGITSSGIGQKEVSISDIEITQQVSKTMTARQDGNHTWNLTKSADPTRLAFGNVCAADGLEPKPVAITVSWQRLAATPGAVTIVTSITVKNNAARTLDVQVTDNIYPGATPSGSPIATKAFEKQSVGARSMVVLTHTYTIAETTDKVGQYYNDEATATYTDPIVLEDPALGSIKARASAQVAAGNTTNTTALIRDSESMTGQGLQFSVAPVSPGQFTNYSADTQTVGPVNWASGAQAGTGSVTFSKTVYLDAPRITAGNLGDRAELLASDGFRAPAAVLSIPISSDARVKIRIEKSIPAGLLDAGESFKVPFTVTKVGDPDFSITVDPLDFSGSTTSLYTEVTDLSPGTYTVTEGTVEFFAAGSSTGVPVPLTDATSTSRTVNLSPGTEGQITCSDTVSFVNTFNPDVKATVAKITLPELAVSDPDFTWTFKLYSPSDVLLDTQTAGANSGPVKFQDGGGTDIVLTQEGTYRVVEAEKNGWDLTGATPPLSSNSKQCAFSVDFPEDQGKTFACSFQNVKRATVSVIKTSEGAPPAGDQVFDFQLRRGASSTAAGTVLEAAQATAGNGGIVAFTALLEPSYPGRPETHYQLCEVVLAGWQSTLGTFVPESFIPPDGVATNPNVDNSIVCIDFTVEPGEVKQVAVENTPPPGGRALTIGYWKNHASCSNSKGKQDAVLDQTLGAGVYIGDLLVDTCLEAVRLLNKSTVTTNRKMASDPAFNLAAQLMAVELNIKAGAGTCGALLTARSAAQTLLANKDFNGVTHKLTKADAPQANSLATSLDRYNNNLLCSP